MSEAPVASLILPDMSAILLEQAERLFQLHATPQTLAAADQDAWPEAAWKAAEEAGLTLAHRNGMPCFDEASLTLYCRKKYADFLHESAFIDKSPLKNYAAGDFHKMYICEIVGADVAQ